MNIAHITPYSNRYPLAQHNGRYHWVHQLAELQVQAGHTVTIYGHPDSQLDTITTQGITSSTSDKRQNNIETFRLAFKNDHDIYHSHFDNLHYEVAHETSRPIVATQHWWPSEETIALAQTSQAANVWAVPPTKYMYEFDQQQHIPSKGYIYHGIDLSLFRHNRVQKNGRLLAVGRISPEKHIDDAIAIAKRAGIGLDIIGKLVDKNRDYWATMSDAIDGEQIRYLGAKSQEELAEYYAKASALLFPADLNEAFGLTAIEAQACGTPVIMRQGGSRGELLVEGETGFLCNSEEQFVTAAHKASKLSPAACRQFAEKFDVNSMAEKYGELYSALLI